MVVQTMSVIRTGGQLVQATGGGCRSRARPGERAWSGGACAAGSGCRSAE
ncbi:hypothetical protein SAMN05421854_103585 [Amycolatopsis rubida]|uniref:Uncharacterized protein n=1 Tax=Amycolatopsis rubida TaxID=112413 RepID=A0A1I5LGQ7_9PSEU|nr:hypothetical protein SAMN05421854_103585 [Amycolatopsis rubida]